MVPSFGAFVVWLPVAMYLAATHHWVQAAILVAVGSVIISTLDNFLYPVLIGTQLRLHTVQVFLSILGGIWLFGVSGMVLGPITRFVRLSERCFLEQFIHFSSKILNPNRLGRSRPPKRRV